MLFKPKRIYASDIIAVAYTGSEIPNFEKGEAFWVYAVDGDKIVRTQILSLYPQNLEEAISQFRYCRLDAIIAKNFGPKAMHALKEAGFKLYSFDGGAYAAAKAYAAGKLSPM